MTRTKAEIDRAYAVCQTMAKTHYENFPVASVLLPKRLRRPIAAIYAFARTADDFADEGQHSPAERLALLENYQQQLVQITDSSYSGEEPIFIALQDSIQQFNLPTELFTDLLTAFKQDVMTTRYANFADVLKYCRYSANPVGRLLLHLQGQPSAQQLSQSDAICSALQLINFYQDVEQDLIEQNRIYLPQDRLLAQDITDVNLLDNNTHKLAPVLKSLYQQTQQMLLDGTSLGTTLSGRLGWEIRAITLAGLITLDKLRQQPEMALLSRPRLSRWDLIKVLLASLLPSTYRAAVYKFS